MKEEHMNKKILISKTRIFLIVIAFVIGFKTIFGEENLLIGVTTITAIMMFLERDLTIEFSKNTIGLIILNLFIGVAAFISNTNMYLAMIINFIVMFCIGYKLCYNLKNPLYIPFALQYLFILVTPINIELLPKRLLSLLIGAISIMIAQLIFNRNKFGKVSSEIIKEVCTQVINKVDLCINEKETKGVENKIQGLINQLRKFIYEKIEKEFYLTEDIIINLNISMSFEKLNLILGNPHVKKDTLNELKEYLNCTFEVLNDYNKVSKLELFLDNIILREHEKNLKELEILNCMMFIKDSLIELNDYGNKKHNWIKEVEEIPSKFKKRELSTSLKLSYATRLATGIAIGGFIMDYFNISEGRWILFTILSIINPIYEVSKEKSKDRIKSTIVGGIIVVLLFSIFKDSTIRGLIIMGTGYIGGFTNKYKYNMICVTISAIGSAALIGSAEILTVNRILFVALGIVIATVVNKLLLPYNLNDANINLRKMYDLTIKEMLIEEYDVIHNERKNSHLLKNLFIITSLIEDKLKANNQIIQDESNLEFIKSRRSLVTNIYQLYLMVIKCEIKEIDIKKVLRDLKELTDYENINIEEYINITTEDINNSKYINDKIIFSIIIEIFEDIKKIESA